MKLNENFLVGLNMNFLVLDNGLKHICEFKTKGIVHCFCSFRSDLVLIGVQYGYLEIFKLNTYDHNNLK